MRESLHICGKILTTEDYHFFALCCEKCDASFGQWSGFLKHLSNKHDFQLPVKSQFISDQNQTGEYDEATIKATLKQEMEAELNKQIKVDAAEYESDGKDMSDGEDNDNAKDLESNDEEPDNDFASSKSEDSDIAGWDMREVNNDSDSSLSDAAPFQEKKKKSKTFTFNLQESYTRNISLKFLKILEKYPILWDQQHPNYWAPEKRTRVLFGIKEYMAKMGYTISDYGVRSVIQRILRDYKAFKQELAVVGRLDERKTMVLKKCKFLDGPQNGTDNVSEAKNDSDGDDIPDDLDEEDFSLSSDAESNDEGNTPGMNDFIRDSRDGKRICFNVAGNPLIDEFVSLVRDNPMLWEVGQFQNLTERKRIVESWIPIFEERHNVTFAYRDLALNLKLIRRTLANIEERKVLNKAAKHLKDICSFLPKAKPIVRLKCEECNKNFLTEYTLQAHKYAAHKIGTNPFRCEVCGHDFTAHNQLDTHLRRVHLKQFSVHCDVCNRGFLQRSVMLLHRQTHTGEKTFVCETCGKTFRRKINMQQHHQRIHLRQRDFNCELCPKTFYLKCHLRDHMNAHLNIRNHICPTCGKAFHSSHALMRHKQIHSEVKRYACKLCEARFHQFVGLNSHMKNKHKFVNDKDDEVAPQPVVHMTTLPATTTPETSMQIKGELVQSMDSWNM